MAKLQDIVAVAAVRTPMGKFGGSFKDWPVYHLGSIAIREALKRSHLTPNQIDDCILGCCRQTGNGTNPARTAARYAALPGEIPATTVTMACASGMRSVIMGGQTILSGDGEIILTGGMESMSTIPYILLDTRWEGFRHGNKILLDGWYDSRDPFIEDRGTGASTENLIAKHGITREEQDKYALESHRKAARAKNNGLFDEEIVPVTVSENSSAGKTLRHDETIRENTSLHKLAQLKPAFAEEGTLTAGNSSSFSDGAAVIILTTRKKAKELDLKPLFSIVSCATGGVENETMGEGPSVVLPETLKKARMTIRDLEFIEVNEAFAGMILANERLLKWERGKVNKHGGAIALGHPVGCSGARILVTLYYILKQHDGEIGGAAIGAAGGVAAAMIIKREN